MNEDDLYRRAAALGIAPGFHDITGVWHAVAPQSLARLLAAIGEPAPSAAPAGEAPAPAFLPDPIGLGGRTWGIAVQLYGLTSARNWGIGDFGDLGALVSRAASAGASAVQLNPLHALFPCHPDHICPYAPSSRLFLNPLYIDIEAEDDFRASAAARDRVGSAGFQATLAGLRGSALVDHEGAAACKWPVLRLMFETFLAQMRDGTDGERAADFRAFRAAGGAALERFAAFEALSAHLHEGCPGGWTTWPAPLQRPESAEVRRFAAEHADAVTYAVYLQWRARRQLDAVAERARRGGMSVGLIADIAIGSDAAGAEAWSEPDLVARDAELGAPPDPFCAEGQTWGAPPWRPQVLADRGFQPLRELLDRTMSWAGGIRFDHVIGLARQFWVPRGAPGAEGAYVAYPEAALVAEVCAASRRHGSLVVGEDLGTVPEGFSDRLRAAGILTTSVLRFARGPDGRFHGPADYPALACVCAGTHDLPPIAGFIEGRDIRVRAAIGGAPESAVAEALAVRMAEVASLRAALGAEGLLADSAREGTPELIAAVHGFIARSASALALAQLEDVFALADQANLPGTIAEHPNWRRKCPVAADSNAMASALADLGELFRRHGRQ